ncbi:hypothetical protein ACFQZ4_49400 [Catellatospora coxensis]|uniref:dCTP deaminase n=1 Tax=Catellatospora coxensis TaxID=310354 RepID=A0A8J3KUN8_9ACTN|nr:hypothetical protein [Catellatospora coxensis]GIG08948.1 hypothetical protein Cco03nite_56480 [Catellatospora coxensis]
MAFLTGIEIRRRIDGGSIEIKSLDATEPFSMDAQVTEDSIDLRLAPAGLALKRGIEFLDYIHHDLDQAYEKVEIPASGYDLLPMQPLITQTLEAVCFPDDLVGLVVTRSTFARMGIMVNCMAPKFAIGIRWAFPLQLVNLTTVPIRIYPYAPVAQLLVSTVVGQQVGYRGKFQDTYSPTAPRISDRERNSLSALNPDAVNRTFHIISRDMASREAAGLQTSSATTAPPAVSNYRVLRRILIATLGTLGLLGFGVCGNLLAAGQISYWQGFALFLLGILSAIFSGASYAVNFYWLRILDAVRQEQSSGASRQNS